MQDFDDSLPMALYRALDSVMPAYRELFARHNLTEPQWRVLRVLWSAESVNSVELSRRTLITTPSLVGILDRMEKKKLVSRIRSTADRRNVHLVATTESRLLQKTVTPQLDAIHRQVEETVSGEELESLKSILQKISIQHESTDSDGHCIDIGQ